MLAGELILYVPLFIPPSGARRLPIRDPQSLGVEVRPFHGMHIIVAEEIDERIGVEERMLEKRFEMTCCAKELEENIAPEAFVAATPFSRFARSSADEDALSQRLTEAASSSGSSVEFANALRLAREHAETEASAAPSSAGELRRVGFGHLACFANAFAATVPVRALADVPAVLLSRTCPLPSIIRRRPGEIELPGSRSSLRSSSSSAGDSWAERQGDRHDHCSPVRRRAKRRPWHSIASPT